MVRSADMKQLSIWDLEEQDEVILIYAKDFTGRRYHEKLKFRKGQFCQELGKWRDAHKDWYYLGIL